MIFFEFSNFEIPSESDFILCFLMLISVISFRSQKQGVKRPIFALYFWRYNLTTGIFKTILNVFKWHLNDFLSVRCHSDFSDLKIRFFRMRTRPLTGDESTLFQKRVVLNSDHRKCDFMLKTGNFYENICFSLA